MTPFDPIALLAMLLTFYPVVGPAALARARQERPDYFSAGTIGGSKGDKLTLPDGRVWDLIFSTGSPDQHWQTIDVTGGSGAGGVDDPFALEPGPLRPLDASAWPAPVARTDFQDLVAGSLAEIDGAVTALEAAMLTIGALGTAAALESALADLDDAAAALGDGQRLLDTLRPEDLVTATASHDPLIVAQTSEYDAEPPGYFPVSTEPPLPPSPPIEVQEPTPPS